PPLSPLSLHDALPISAKNSVVTAQRKRVFPGLAAGQRRLPFLAHPRQLGRIVNRFHIPIHPARGRHSRVFIPAVVVPDSAAIGRSEEHTSELQSRVDL